MAGPWDARYCVTNSPVTLTNARDSNVDYFARADVVRNPPDESGFRSPSPYWAHEIKSVNPSGSAVYAQDAANACPGNPGLYWTEVSPSSVSNSHVFGNVYDAGKHDLRSENSLKQQCLAQIKDQKINLAMTFAFAKQTISMIDARASKILEVHRAVKAKNIPRLRRLLKIKATTGPQLYLEFLFGWSQLFDDMIGGAKALDADGRVKNEFIYGRARSTSEYVISETRAPNAGWSAPAILNADGSSVVEQRMVLIARVRHALMSDQARLGLLNPAELIWDIIPWSWAINTLIGIGSWLSSLDAMAGLDPMGGSYTVHKRTSYIVTPNPNPNGVFNWRENPFVVSFSMIPGHFSETRMDRTVVSDFSTSIEWKNPIKGPAVVTAAVLSALAVTLYKDEKAYDWINHMKPPRIPRRGPRRPRNLPPINFN